MALFEYILLAFLASGAGGSDGLSTAPHTTLGADVIVQPNGAVSSPTLAFPAKKKKHCKWLCWVTKNGKRVKVCCK